MLVWQNRAATMQALEKSNPTMSQAVSPQKQGLEREVRLRTLLHELGNSLEVVLYASDLLNQSLLNQSTVEVTSREWAGKLATEARKAVAAHREMQTMNS